VWRLDAGQMIPMPSGSFGPGSGRSKFKEIRWWHRGVSHSKYLSRYGIRKCSMRVRSFVEYSDV